MHRPSRWLLLLLCAVVAMRGFTAPAMTHVDGLAKHDGQHGHDVAQMTHAQGDTCCPDNDSGDHAAVKQTPTSCHCVGLCGLIATVVHASRAGPILRVVAKWRSCTIAQLDGIWRPPAAL